MEQAISVTVTVAMDLRRLIFALQLATLGRSDKGTDRRAFSTADLYVWALRCRSCGDFTVSGDGRHSASSRAFAARTMAMEARTAVERGFLRFRHWRKGSTTAERMPSVVALKSAIRICQLRPMASAYG